MNIYQIYVPELGLYVKYKVLEPEEAKTLVAEIETKTAKQYRKAILESVIFNIKTDVADSLRVMTRSAAEKCLDALYAGCIMLNPGLDIDQWIDLAYAKSVIQPKKPFDSNLDSGISESDLADIFEKTFKKEEKKQLPKPKKITKEKFIGLESYLKSNIIGQDEAVDSVVSALKRSQVGLNDENRPLGVFLFAGASGVGKTHLANSLHKYLFGSENSLVRIDCGEFQHKHENQKLIGSPPGYIGHDEGGQLVNMVRKFPNTVVLLDEVEKAHQDIWNTFLRVFDDGVLTDNKGKQVSFKNTIVIMTTNLGNDKISNNMLRSSAGFNARVDFNFKTKQIPERSQVEKQTLEEIRKHFKPEFINRLDKIAIFNHLSPQDMLQIAELEMDVVKSKLLSKGYSVIYTEAVLNALIEKGVDAIKGARGIAQIRREMIEDKLAELMIQSVIPRGTIFHMDYENEFSLRLNKPKKEQKAE
jgi:ATP-dependent Clp protease ATP-binding subunit ClpA